MDGFFDDQHIHFVLYGGRGSGKSWDVAQNLVLWALEKKERILCCREFQTSIKQSVKKLLSDTIERLGLQGLFKITDRAIHCPMTGSEFMFAGLWNNFENIKSTEGITIAWIEEAQTVSEQSIDVLVPTVLRSCDHPKIIYTMNPRFPTDYVYKEHIAPDEPRRHSKRLNVNWRENPWFSKPMQMEMETMKEINYSKYLHIWEGELLVDDEALIFRGNVTVEAFETPDDAQHMFGADFGFANDPSTLVRTHMPPPIHMMDNAISQRTVYVDFEAGGVGIEIDDHPKLYDTVPMSRHYPIIADSARPETISYIKRHGFAIKGAIKGPGSVEDGVSWLQSQRIFVHPRCVEAVLEFNTYKFKRHHQTNEIMRVPEDKNNHYIDALRYAWESQWTRSEFMLDV